MENNYWISKTIEEGKKMGLFTDGSFEEIINPQNSISKSEADKISLVRYDEVGENERITLQSAEKFADLFEQAILDDVILFGKGKELYGDSLNAELFPDSSKRSLYFGFQRRIITNSKIRNGKPFAVNDIYFNYNEIGRKNMDASGYFGENFGILDATHPLFELKDDITSDEYGANMMEDNSRTVTRNPQTLVDLLAKIALEVKNREI